jgi:LuxR family transcriptional regulator, quorum-sensing system regulator CciR
MFDRIHSFVRDVGALKTEPELAEVLTDLGRHLGFRYFALTHHLDVRNNNAAIRIHNYPRGWADWFDEQGLSGVDPVHRASQKRIAGFSWSKLGDLLILTPQDVSVLEAARKRGIGDGFTVPAHVPGEPQGSISFATETGMELDREVFPLLQLVGGFAFECARRLRPMHGSLVATLPRLTDRQRECVRWVACGKSNWEISRIMNLSKETVIDHLKEARERYGVANRTSLTVHALFDGSIAFHEIIPH